jgi:hypothetical protein
MKGQTRRITVARSAIGNTWIFRDLRCVGNRPTAAAGLAAAIILGIDRVIEAIGEVGGESLPQLIVSHRRH